MLDPGLTEHASDRQRERVISVADDDPRRPLQSPEERLPRRLILTPKGLKTPHPRDRRPPRSISFVASDGRQDMKARTVVRAAVDPEVLTIDRQRMRPAAGQLSGAHEPCADIDPVRDQLPLVRRRATRRLTGRELSSSFAACDLRRRPITRSFRNRYQRLADLPRREPILPRARLPLPRLKPRRALHAERMRLPLTGQNRRKPMFRAPIPRATPPPLPTMRRLPIPTTTNHHRTGVLSDRTFRNFHRPATLSLQPDVSTQIE